MITADHAQAIKALKFLHTDGAVFEVCIISPKNPKCNLFEGFAGGEKATVSGWFQDPQKAAELVTKIEAAGIYVTLNPCKEAYLARANHRLKVSIPRTEDKHIEAYKNLLIDVDADPGGVSGVSSTDAEHDAALEMAQIIRADLTKDGWVEPLSADSGNGGHLTYAVDLPNTPESVELIKAVLQALALRYQDELSRRNLGIDTSVFNPARLTKLYGTWVRKGDSTKTRPHRLATILSLPEARQPVPLELLQKQAAIVLPKTETQKKEIQSDRGRVDVPAYLAHYGRKMVKVKPYADGLLYCLEECIFDPSHSPNESGILQAADGTLSYQCFHDSCKGRTWKAARKIISGAAKLTLFMVGKSSPKATPSPALNPGESEPEKISWVGHLYFVECGRLCLEVIDREGPHTRPLANFQARIEEEITRDDGLRPVREFLVRGSLETGRPLPPARIPAREFDGLAWIRRDWGAGPCQAPGRSLGPHLLNAIQAHSQGIKRRMVYAHSGWRKINGGWRYLHGGGAIGQGKPVEVDLGENLHLYRLSEPGGIEAAQASLRFLDIGPWEILAPLISCAYLAPFADLEKIDFSLWIYGKTGGLKSSLAALALSHFGKFLRTTLPGSWFSTANSLEKLIFTLKDSLCVIDDFVPPANFRESHLMTEKAARIIYQAGNRSGRGRLTADLNARPDHYPRCLIISTGEILLPGQRQSATARYLGIELDPEKTLIDLSRLTAAQAESHLYSGAMAAYLEDLAPRLDAAQKDIRALFEAYRRAFQSGAHLRIPEIQAWLTVGFEMFLRFQTRMKTISQGQADEMLKRAWEVFEALGEKHSRIIEGERPTLKFLAVLKELFYQGRIYVESANLAGAPPQRKDDLGWAGTDPAKNAELVGWADDSTLYLMPETAMRVVNEAIRRQGDFLSLGKNEMLAALAREGFIDPGKDSQQGRNTHVKKMQGTSKRVICLPLEKLAHDEVLEDENL
jgi:hypothetical protein